MIKISKDIGEKETFYKKLNDIIYSNKKQLNIIEDLNAAFDSGQFNLFFTYELFLKNTLKNNITNNEIVFLEFLANIKYKCLNYETQKEVLNSLAFKYWQNNNFRSAIYTIKRFNSEFKERDDKSYAICLNVSGLVNSKLGKQEEALDIFYKAQELLTKLKETKEAQSLIMNLNNNIALVYRDQNKYESAIKIINQNILIQEKNDNKEGVSSSYMNIGNVYYFKKDYNKAIEYNLKAQKIKQEIGDTLLSDRINVNLATFYFELGKLDIVKKYTDKCLSSNDKLTQKLISGMVLRLELEKYKKGTKTDHEKQSLTEFANSCLENINSLNNNSYKLEDYSIIAEALKIAGDSKKALSLLNEKFKIYKEQNDGERHRAYKHLREVHEVQLQQKEIEQKEDQLQQKENTNLKLQQINNDLEQFTYMASHDLKSPLRNIIAFSSLIKEEDVSKADINDYADLIKNDAKKMSKLITSLLKHSKIDNTQIEMGNIKLGNLVKAVVKNLNQEIIFKNALVDIGELSEIKGNKILLEQLFINLIENALKYNDSNKPIIKIYSELKGTKVLVKISDNGIGLPEAMKEEVFKAFTRAHSETKYEGSGVGLATCKKIMTIHYGRISVSSEIGKGSCFTLSFNK